MSIELINQILLNEAIQSIINEEVDKAALAPTLKKAIDLMRRPDAGGFKGGHIKRDGTLPIKIEADLADKPKDERESLFSETVIPGLWKIETHIEAKMREIKGLYLVYAKMYRNYKKFQAPPFDWKTMRNYLRDGVRDGTLPFVDIPAFRPGKKPKGKHLPFSRELIKAADEVDNFFEKTEEGKKWKNKIGALATKWKDKEARVEYHLNLDGFIYVWNKQGNKVPFWKRLLKAINESDSSETRAGVKAERTGEPGAYREVLADYWEPRLKPPTEGDPSKPEEKDKICVVADEGSKCFAKEHEAWRYYIARKDALEISVPNTERAKAVASEDYISAGKKIWDAWDEEIQGTFTTAIVDASPFASPDEVGDVFIKDDIDKQHFLIGQYSKWGKTKFPKFDDVYREFVKKLDKVNKRLAAPWLSEEHPYLIIGKEIFDSWSKEKQQGFEKAILDAAPYEQKAIIGLQHDTNKQYRLIGIYAKHGKTLASKFDDLYKKFLFPPRLDPEIIAKTDKEKPTGTSVATATAAAPATPKKTETLVKLDELGFSPGDSLLNTTKNIHIDDEIIKVRFLNDGVEINNQKWIATATAGAGMEITAAQISKDGTNIWIAGKATGAAAPAAGALDFFGGFFGGAPVGKQEGKIPLEHALKKLRLMMQPDVDEVEIEGKNKAEEKIKVTFTREK